MFVFLPSRRSLPTAVFSRAFAFVSHAWITPLLLVANTFSFFTPSHSFLFREETQKESHFPCFGKWLSLFGIGLFFYSVETAQSLAHFLHLKVRPSILLCGKRPMRAALSPHAGHTIFVTLENSAGTIFIIRIPPLCLYYTTKPASSCRNLARKRVRFVAIFCGFSQQCGKKLPFTPIL